MGSKVIVFLGLFLAMVFLISSEVAARDLATTSYNTVDVSSAETDQDPPTYSTPVYGGGGGCPYGCCGEGIYGAGCRCCSFAGEKADAGYQAEPKN